MRFTYTDNVEHEATLMNCLMAGTGSGKGCIDEPISHIMADIERRDAENTRREAEWKKDCQKKGANKDKLLRPEGLVIQVIDPDMTKPALVTSMDEAEGHFVYVKLNELDLFEQLKGRRFFRKVLTDGPISRINFCTIPEDEIGACVIYVANGQKWEKQIEDFVRWSLEYDLWCKMQFFGAEIDKATKGDDSRIGTRGPQNLLRLLPDEFTLEDAKRVRRQEGLSNEGYTCIKMIRNWVSRGYVTQNSEFSFKKSDNYKPTRSKDNGNTKSNS